MNFSDMKVLIHMIIFHLLFGATKEEGLHLDLGVQFTQLKDSYFQVCMNFKKNLKNTAHWNIKPLILGTAPMTSPYH